MSDDIVEVYSAANEADAHIMALMLQENGLKPEIVGEGLPFVGSEPSAGWLKGTRIWVREEDAARARELIDDAIAARSHADSQPLDPRGWTCPKCDAEVEAGFDVCWKCLYNPSAC